MPEPLPQIALAEFQRRVDQARELVRTRQRPEAWAHAQLRPWAAIAAWCGADVRALIVPQPGVPAEEIPVWLDFCHPRERADDALHRIATECRRAYTAALARDDHPRTVALARIDTRLSIATGLPRHPSDDPEQAEGRPSRDAGLPAWQPEPAKEAAA